MHILAHLCYTYDISNYIVSMLEKLSYNDFGLVKGEQFKQPQLHSVCFGNSRRGNKNLIFVGGASGVGKSTISSELGRGGFNVVGSGDLLCQAAGISRDERHRFYTLDFRRYEQGMINALVNELDVLPPGETLVYDTRYAVTSEEISNGTKKWIPGMSREYLEQLLGTPQLDVWNVLIEPESISELCERRIKDTSKQRQNGPTLISSELFETRRQFGIYTQIGRELASDPIRGIAVVANPKGKGYPIRIAGLIKSLVR